MINVFQMSNLPEKIMYNTEHYIYIFLLTDWPVISMSSTSIQVNLHNIHLHIYDFF